MDGIKKVDGSGSGIDSDTVDGKHATDFVPTTLKVNNKALSSDISLTASDVGALPITGGTLTGRLNVGDNLKFFSDLEGGNIIIIPPDSDGGEWEIDAYNGNLRAYYRKGSTVDATYTFGKNGTITAGSFSGKATSAGTADTANTLTTSRNIFGQSFNGSSNVDGQALVYGTYKASPSDRFSSYGLQIREQDYNKTGSSDIGYAPGIGFHWGGFTGGSLVMGSDGQFRFLASDGSTLSTLQAKLNSSNILGTGFPSTSTATGANSVSQTGVYTVPYVAGSGGTADRPFAVFSLVHIEFGGGYAYQIAFDHSSGSVIAKARRCGNWVWSNWYTVFNSASQADIPIEGPEVFSPNTEEQPSANTTADAKE